MYAVEKGGLRRSWGGLTLPPPQPTGLEFCQAGKSPAVESPWIGVWGKIGQNGFLLKRARIDGSINFSPSTH